MSTEPNTGSSPLESLDRHVHFVGTIIRAGTERVRHADGTEVTRDKVWHPGAVAMLAVDDDSVWLTRQPREAIGAADSLEIPAGKRDVPGEPPLETAIRELAEEIGLRAQTWDEIFAFFPTPGFADEHIHLYCATGLAPVDPSTVQHPDEDERIEIVPWPLDRLDDAISACHDAKSLIALLWLARRRDREHD